MKTREKRRSRQIIPPRRMDQWYAGTGVAMLLLAVWAVTAGAFGTGWFWWNAIGGCVELIIAYVFQSPPDVTPPADFVEARKRLQKLSTEVDVLTDFMKKQLRRVNEVQQTLARLSKERERLAPLVQGDRDTVAAILEAHGAVASRQRWKEWVAGFVIGVAASAAAQYLIELFRSAPPGTPGG